MTEIEKAIAKFESRYAVVDCMPSSRSPTGERYREFVTPPRDTVGETVVDMVAAAETYAANKVGGTLYWRVRPEIAERNGLFRGYLRLLITDKPPIEECKQAA